MSNRRKIPVTAPCADCGEHTLGRNKPHEWYMVHDRVWAKAGMKPKGGYLCISCLETRLGRRLRHADFTDAPCNDPEWGWKTARLKIRLAC